MKLAVIGGSGLYAVASLAGVSEHRVMTDWGEPSAAIRQGSLHGSELLFLARHGTGHHLPPHRVNYRANIAALAELGAEGIVATAAVGGIDPGATPGTIIVPHQVIDYTYGREHTYFDGTQPHPTHVDFTEPYTAGLRAKLCAAARACNVSVQTSGVYGATQGPRLESAAEIDRLERDGCTIVGMTGMPEAALARELGIDYANISLVVNPAAGRAAGPIRMDEIELELERGMARIIDVIESLARLLASS